MVKSSRLSCMVKFGRSLPRVKLVPPVKLPSRTSPHTSSHRFFARRTASNVIVTAMERDGTALQIYIQIRLFRKLFGREGQVGGTLNDRHKPEQERSTEMEVIKWSNDDSL